MPLLGTRVLLRALETRDLDSIWEAYKDFDLELTTSGDSPPVSDEQVRAFWRTRIEHPAAEMRYFAIEPGAGQQGAGQFAGMCNLQDIDYRNRHAELALWLASPALRGLGYGSDAIRALLPYAFDVVRLDKLYLGVYDFNESGIRCYERIGFRYEGCLRQQIHYQGRYWDEWAMRMLRDEWEQIRQPPADGLRPYHPADQDAAIQLIQEIRALPTGEMARAQLRCWWRRIDCDVYSYQVKGALVGLAAITRDEPAIVDKIVSAAHRTGLTRVLREKAVFARIANSNSGERSDNRSMEKR